MYISYCHGRSGLGHRRTCQQCQSPAELVAFPTEARAASSARDFATMLCGALGVDPLAIEEATVKYQPLFPTLNDKISTLHSPAQRSERPALHPNDYRAEAQGNAAHCCGAASGPEYHVDDVAAECCQHARQASASLGALFLPCKVIVQSHTP